MICRQSLWVPWKMRTFSFSKIFKFLFLTILLVQPYLALGQELEGIGSSDNRGFFERILDNLQFKTTEKEEGELVVTPLDLNNRLLPLDGHTPHIRANGIKVFLGGFKVWFTFSHNKKEANSIRVNGIKLVVDEFIFGLDSSLSYRVDSSRIPPQGVVEPHRFQAVVNGRSVILAKWIESNSVRQAESPGDLLSTNPPIFFHLNESGDDVEDLMGTIVMTGNGFYTVHFVVAYTVSGKDKKWISNPIQVYQEE